MRARLEEEKQQGAAIVSRNVMEQSGNLFAEAVSERRLARYRNSAVGVAGVALEIYNELIKVSPDYDLSGLIALLSEVSRDEAVEETIRGSSAKEAFPAVLMSLTPENISGSRLLALTKELYAQLREVHPDLGSLDHSPMILLQADALADEGRQALLNQADMLQAEAWNDHLAPLFQEALQLASVASVPEDALMIASLEAFMKGEAPVKIQDNLAGRLFSDRDGDTAILINDYLAGLSVQDAWKTKASLIAALYVFDAPRVPIAVVRMLETLPAAERNSLREGLLQGIIAPQAALLPLAETFLQEMSLPREEGLLYLYLLSGTGWQKLYAEDFSAGLRLSIRANAPRVRAAQTIAAGGGVWFSQMVNSLGKVLALFGTLLSVDTLLLIFLMRSSNEWRMDMKWLLILLIVDFMLVFQVLPLGYMLYKAFTPQGSFSLQTFERLFSYNMNRSALFNTIFSALSAMVLGTMIAFPLAWLVGRTNLYGKKFFRHLFVLTYMVPPYVGAMAWLRLLNPNVGSINLIIRGLFGLTSAVGPLNIYSMGGMVWVLTTFFYPYAFITISRAMEKMDPSLEEASRISGASPFLTLVKVTLPIMTPSLIAGALLVFVSAASAYGIPSIIGAPGRVHTVTTRIIEYYGRGAQGLNDAVGLSVFLMTLALLILYISDFVLAKKQYITVSGKSTRPNIVDLRSWRVPLTVFVGLFATLVVLLPFATILTTSLKIDVGKSVLAVGNFTLTQWTNIFSRSETLSSLKNSLVYASVSASVGILVAITMSYLMQRTKIRGRKLPDFLITLGSGSPSVVIALGLIMSMQGRFGVNIYNTAYILIVAYLVKYMMMGMRTVTSAISQIHVSLEESSQVSGASWMTTMRKVTGPLIFPSIAAGWFLIFIPCFYELAMTTLLYSNSTKTIGFQLYEYWTFTSQPQASAMAFGILLIVISINLIFNRLSKGEFSI